MRRMRFVIFTVLLGFCIGPGSSVAWAQQPPVVMAPGAPPAAPPPAEAPASTALTTPSMTGPLVANPNPMTKICASSR